MGVWMVLNLFRKEFEEGFGHEAFRYQRLNIKEGHAF